MGQLFNRLSTGWTDHQPSPLITENFITIKPIVKKRKCLDENLYSKKRKIVQNDNTHLLLSPKIKKSSSSYFSNTSFSLSPMISFECQLCHDGFSNKDYYLDHMISCAVEHHASIKIVRAKKSYCI